jgi:hypothetical protein
MTPGYFVNEGAPEMKEWDDHSEGYLVLEKRKQGDLIRSKQKQRHYE